MSSDRTIKLLFNKKYPKEIVVDSFRDAESQLVSNFEDYVEDDVASYLAIPFGGSLEALLNRFDLYPDVKPEDDFVWESISEEADSELKMLKKFRPEYFDDRFDYGFGWRGGEFGIFVYLTREEYEDMNKKSNPDKYEPRFLSWCKSYEEEVKEFEDLIDSKPQDEKQLRKEYEELTGKKYRKTSKSKSKFLKLRLVKNPNDKFSASSYITKRFGLLEKIEKLVDNGFEVYSDDYRTHITKDKLSVSVLSDPNAFITSDLFRYTDYGGAYTLAKANIRYIEENHKDLIDQELIQSYGTAHNGENLEFKFRALENDELYEELLALDGYPLLSDDTLSEVEQEIEQECWDSYGRDEFKQAIDEKFEGELELSDDELDTLAYEAAQYTSEGMGHTENMDFVFDIEGLIEALDKVMDEDKVKQIKKENPSWVKDEELWEKAKKQSLKSYGKISYPFVVYIYKQMGGKIKKGKK